MNRFIVLFLLWIQPTVFTPASAAAQAIGPSLDPRPFMRPEPTLLIDRGDPTNILQRALVHLKTNGFTLFNKNLRDFVLEVRKPLPARFHTTGHEAVLIWLERDVAQPTTIKVHLSFARFMAFGFSSGKLERVVVPELEEAAELEKWRPKLLEILTNEGG
jgi:hypothetical protein